MLTAISLGKKISILLLLMVFAIIAWGAVSFYQFQIKELRHRVENELTTISTLKAGQIEVWSKERLGDGGVIMDSPIFIEVVSQWLSHADDALMGKMVMS